MKRLASLLLSIGILLSLCACGAAVKEETTLPDVTTIPTQTEYEQLVLRDLSDLIPDPDLAYLAAITLSDTTLYALCKEMEGGTTLHLVDVRSGQRTEKRLDIHADEITFMEYMGDSTLLLMVCTGDVYSLIWLDSSGNVLNTVALSHWEIAWKTMVDAPRGELWYVDIDGAAWQVDFADGSAVCYDTPGELMSVWNGVKAFSMEDGSVLTETDGQVGGTYWTGSQLFFAAHGGYLQTDDPVIGEGKQTFFLDYAEPETICRVQDVGQMNYICQDGKVLCSTELPEGVRLRMLDLKAEAQVGCMFPDAQELLWYKQAECDGRIAMHVGIDSEHKLFLWDYSQEETEPLEVEKLTEDTLPVATEELSMQIYQQTGFQTHPSCEAEKPAGVYEFETEYSDLAAYATLHSVQRILNLYPPEVLEGLANYVEKPNIYFASHIRDTSVDTAWGETNACTYVSEGQRVVVLSILNTTPLTHELMHAMEDNLIEYINEGNGWTDYRGYWSTFNPDGFEYPMTYAYSFGEQEHQWTTSENYQDAYFITAYSKSMPTEDRADLMMALTNRTGWQRQELYDAPHVYEKAVYLCALLRGCYGYESAFWEEGIEAVPLSDYAQAVEAWTSQSAMG